MSRRQRKFWDSWVKEVFPSLLRGKKYFKYKRDAKVGDVVLRKDETASGQTYKYARIMGVHVRVNGKVRLADVEYKIPGETKFRVTMRLIHKLVLVVPVEEQTMDKGELPGGEGETHLRGQGSPTGGAEQTPEGQSGEVAEEQTLVL
jgi:hypothetical protein